MALQFYPFGFSNIWGQPNENEMTQYLANISAFKQAQDTANQNITQANELAKNHPATNLGLALGNILGNWGGWRAGQAFQKYLEGKPKLDLKVQPITYTNNQTGAKFSLGDVQKMLADGKSNVIPKNYNFPTFTPQTQVSSPSLNLQNPITYRNPTTNQTYNLNSLPDKFSVRPLTDDDVLKYKKLFGTLQLNDFSNEVSQP